MPNEMGSVPGLRYGKEGVQEERVVDVGVGVEVEVGVDRCGWWYGGGVGVGW